MIADNYFEQKQIKSIMEKSNVWMSVSDLMTGLMIIFLFIAIAYIKEIQDNLTGLKDFVENKQNLHDKLVEQFKTEAEDSIITIGGDLSMRFQKAETSFADGSWEIKDEFKKQLRVILPKYLDILLNDTMRYKIREIRIEGHTNNIPYPQIDKDPYIANLILSQRRALSVMRFMRDLPEYKRYTPEQKRLTEFWFTANGLSYGHALDKNGNYALVTGKAIEQEKSRRVEFRIITTGEEILDDFIANTQK